jgi:acetyl/propionyl-CoA carboxylase alpha subunit
MITGIDLVDAQIRIAEGERITVAQQDIAVGGHAIECRLYAESPDEGFAPTSGTIHHCRFPDVPDSRVDAAIQNGTVISPYYDPMLAKLITWGGTREDAIRRMRSMLAGTQSLGVVTNAAMLGRLVASSEFSAFKFNTQFLERNLRRYVEPLEETRMRRFACIAAVVRHLAVSTAGVDERHPRESCLLEGGKEYRVRVAPLRTQEYTFDVTCAELVVRVELLATPGDREFVFRVGDAVHRVHAIAVADSIFIHLSAAGTLEFAIASTASTKAGTDIEGKHRAAMPGRIIEICVAEGACVTPGERLLAMESMKMEHAIIARMPGVVRLVPTAVGQVVEKGSLLISIDYDVVGASVAAGGVKS